jgi:hypothetical protein
MAKTVGLLVNPDTSGAADIKLGQNAARDLGLELRIISVTRTYLKIASEYGSAINVE